MAPPVSNGHFFHSGDKFYVQVGKSWNPHRHARAEVEQLERLLKPSPPRTLSTKPGKPYERQPEPMKDEVGHWYAAQVLHYGLQPTNAKATAKKRLLQALEAGKLHVPQGIQKIEDDLRQEYNALDVLWQRDPRVEEKQTEEKEMRDTQVAEAEYQKVNENMNKVEQGGRKRKAGGEDATPPAKKGKKIPLQAHGDDYFDPSGHYEVFSPEITEQWGDTSLKLVLALDHSTSTLWGRYDFGIFSGVIRFSRLPPHKARPQGSLACLWRGREHGEEQISVGDDCNGSATFIGREIRGTLNLCGDCPFVARWSGPVPRTVVVKACREKWEAYNEEAYETERGGRWY